MWYSKPWLGYIHSNLCINGSALRRPWWKCTRLHLNVFKPLPGIGHFDIYVLEEVSKWIMIKMHTFNIVTVFLKTLNNVINAPLPLNRRYRYPATFVQDTVWNKVATIVFFVAACIKQVSAAEWQRKPLRRVTMGDFTFWLNFRWANSLSESSVEVPT